MQDKKTFKKNQLRTRYNFARQVRLLRESKDLSIKELAQESHIFEWHLQELEMGKMENWGEIFALAQFFDKKVEINFV